MKPIKLSNAQMDGATNVDDLPGGADELRRIVKVMDNTAEWALDGLSMAELIRLFTAHKACEWDYYPDQWTPLQRRDAARLGTVPTFDDNGLPVEVDTVPSVDSVECPIGYCGARPGNPCLNMKGNRVAFHPARYAARDKKPDLTSAEIALLHALK